MFPVASSHHFKTISHLRELFTSECVPAIVMSDNRPPFNGDKFRQFSRDFDFIHTTSSPHFHQLNGFIESMVKKVKNTYKKTDRSINAQAKALLQLHDTPITAYLLSPAEILHGRPAQGTVLSRPSRKVNIHQICQRLVELQEKQKEQFDRAHWARDLHPLKVKERVQFFQNKQATGPHQVDNRYCGWNTRMWMILHDQRPQQQSLQKESSSFKANLSWQLLLSRPSSNERGKTDQRQFLSRPSGQIHVFQQQSELHRWWSRLHGHPVHDIWWPRDMSNTPDITSNVTP